METISINAQGERPSLSGRFGPFAARWSWWTALLGPLAFGVWLISAAVAIAQFHSVAIPVQFGLPAALLLGMFAAQQRWCFPDLRLTGDLRGGAVVSGIVIVTLLYLVDYGAALWMGQPREPRMVRLYDGLTSAQIAVMLVSMPILAPIVEELVFRHFLLSVLPFKKSGTIAGLAVVVTAALFSLVHKSAYIFPTTFVLLFALGVVFAVARIRTDGVALPMGLHAYAIVFGLMCDQAMKFLKG
ncbi:CPBP family intramembrane glutamic endopeptidase [Ralstonia pseudosolanacearum]|uniref:CPBP family intramembrane glutamic endopeptidase n=1 Tax=Ralstonia pseudosolanacearum TaxID=1310165 RepID=UPI003CEB4A76